MKTDFFKKIKGLDGFALKIIATVSMLVDHIGVIFVHQLPYEVVIQLRTFGRISFPIFAFLIVQGFLHTADRMQYLARLLGFGGLIIIVLALISRLLGVEVPTQLNIFITLSFGLIALWWIEFYWKTSWFFTSAVLFFFIVLADFIHVDYGAYGVLTIILFYVARNNLGLMAIGFMALTTLNVGIEVLKINNASILQLYSIAALPLIFMYNGKKGVGKFKYFFYFFYPAHFSILIILRYILFGA
ncbi:MAG: TraX family protein [Culicoidibacterales bacterium]